MGKVSYKTTLKDTLGDLERDDIGSVLARANYAQACHQHIHAYLEEKGVDFVFSGNKSWGPQGQREYSTGSVLVEIKEVPFKFFQQVMLPGLRELADTLWMHYDVISVRRPKPGLMSIDCCFVVDARRLQHMKEEEYDRFCNQLNSLWVAR